MKEIVTFEPPETVVITIAGELGPDQVEEMYKKWASYIKQGKKCKVMVDASKMTDVSPKAREALRKGGGKFLMSKVVILGASTKIRIMGGLILKMLPNVEQSKYVKTEDEARVWLAEK